jgi:hypothetical protein
VPTQGPAGGSDERLREEQIDADERLREEQIRPMSGLLSAAPNNVCPRVGKDADGVGMVMAAGAGAGIEVFGLGVSATGVGAPSRQAGLIDEPRSANKPTVREKTRLRCPHRAMVGGGSGTSGRSPMRSVRRMSARTKTSNRSSLLPAESYRLRTFVNLLGLVTAKVLPADTRTSTTGPSGRSMATSRTPASARLPSSLRNPAALCSPVLRSISVPCESMIETARPQTSVPGCGRRFVHCPAFGGARPCPAGTSGDRRVPRNSSGHQHRQAARGGKITDTRMGLAMSGCAKSRHDR